MAFLFCSKYSVTISVNITTYFTVGKFNNFSGKNVTPFNHENQITSAFVRYAVFYGFFTNQGKSGRCRDKKITYLFCKQHLIQTDRSGGKLYISKILHDSFKRADDSDFEYDLQ